jgi:cell shape-determining protein MreD
MFHVKLKLSELGGPIWPLVAAYTGGTRPQPQQPASNGPINALSALFAFVLGVIHAGLAPVLSVGDLRPNLILAGVATVTALSGLDAGIAWAFVGGLTVNLLTTDPLGSVPLGLLLVVGLTTGIGRLLGRHGAVLALLAGALGSLLVDLIGMVVLVLVGGAPASQPGSLLALLLPTAAVNAVLAAVLFVVARAALSRFGFEPAPT